MKVIIPAWIINEQLIELTRNAVASIRQDKDVQIIIIDNGSPMGGGLLRELADIYIRNKENLGYAKAVNQGLKLCDNNDIVAISNNDIRVPANWQSIALPIFENNCIGSVHFRMIPYDQPFNPGHDTWIGGKERWCTSSFFLTRNMQLYDENFINNCDDWDKHKRMRKAGYKQAYTNKVEYQHKDSFTQKLVTKRSENDIKSREYFKLKWGATPEEDFEKEFPGELAKAWLPQP
jgi:GT2 family glycosyltransferase